MQIILGAGGPVANALTKELLQLGHSPRLVSRRQINPPPNATWMAGDLLNKQQVLAATKGATVIYMCAGLKYDSKVWQTEWPIIINNVIDAAKAANARLIFFDNVYMYGRVQGAMLESSPFNPSSIKGTVRAKVAEQLLGEIKAGNIRASLARAADFYGAESMNSFLDSMVLDKFSKKSKAMWIGNPSTRHSFTYIPDAGKAVALLGADPNTDGQTWHLPTAPALTGSEVMNMAADIFQTKPSYTRVSKLMLNMLGLFNKLIGESSELYYQYQYDYIFNSTKFENHFKVKPTSYKDGIKALSEGLFKR